MAWLNLKIDEDVARKMNRSQYYSMMSYLRYCRRIIIERLEA